MQKRRAEGRVLQAKEMLARRDGQRGSHSCCNMTSQVRTKFAAFVAAIASSSTPPPLNLIRISVAFVGAQSFFGHGFFDARAPRMWF